MESSNKVKFLNNNNQVDLFALDEQKRKRITTQVYADVTGNSDEEDESCRGANLFNFNKKTIISYIRYSTCNSVPSFKFF